MNLSVHYGIDGCMRTHAHKQTHNFQIKKPGKNQPIQKIQLFRFFGETVVPTSGL